MLPSRLTDASAAFGRATAEAEAFFADWAGGEAKAAPSYLFGPLLDSVAAVVALPASELTKAVLLGADRAGVVVSAPARERALAKAERAVADWPTNANPEGEPPSAPINPTPSKSTPVDMAAVVVPLHASAEPALEAAAPAVDPFDMESAPPLMADIWRWSQQYAFRPVREFGLAASMAVLAPTFGRRFSTPTGLPLNVYLVALAPTSGGKEAALGAPQTLLDAAGFSWALGPNDFTSDTAIEVALRVKPNQTFFLDEFAKLLLAVQGKNAASFARLAAKTILELYTKGGQGSRYTGKQKAGDGEDKSSNPIYSPTLTILGCSTVDGFFEALTETNLTDGFINRLTVIRGSKAAGRNMDPARLNVSPALIGKLQAAYKASQEGAGNLAGVSARCAGDRPTLRPVPWGQGGESAWLDASDFEEAQREAGREGVFGRYAEQVQKFATLRALARDPGGAAVTADDVQWARGLVDASVATIEEGVRLNMAGSEFEALCKAVERAVGVAGPDGIRFSYLQRAKGVSRHEDRLIEAAIKRLESVGAVVTVLRAIGDGKPAARRIRLRRPDE
jgi:hypothetical protein